MGCSFFEMSETRPKRSSRRLGVNSDSGGVAAGQHETQPDAKQQEASIKVEPSSTQGPRNALQSRFRPRNFIKVDTKPSQNDDTRSGKQNPHGPAVKAEPDATKGKSNIARPTRNYVPVAQQVVFGGTVGAGAAFGSKQGALKGLTNQKTEKGVGVPISPKQQQQQQQQQQAARNGSPRSSTHPQSNQRVNKSVRSSVRVIGDTSDSSSSDTDTSMEMELSLQDQDAGYPFTQLDPENAAPQQSNVNIADETEQDFRSLMEELVMLSSSRTDADGDLMLFQLPSILPIAAIKNDSEELCEDRPSGLGDLPSMKIGKLLVLQSGAMKMQIGDVLFDVAPSIPCKMRQEAALIDINNKECTMLGPVTQRVVVTPDVEHLLMSGGTHVGEEASPTSEASLMKRGQRGKR